MNTNKLTYWLALGVFALGLHSEYRNGRLPAIHRVAEHAESTLCRIVARAEQTVALARVLTSPQPAAADDLLASARDREMAQAELLRDQARAHAQLLGDQVRAQTDLIRAQAELQQSQIEQIRWHTQSQFRLTNAAHRRVTLICPKTGARISVKAGPSDVEVGDNF
ncbi:MAG TPA: hypothetical protein VEK84_00280 [Terriglobales bacterium]|nr:hypothetical protein [Terriglobales bacterium]